MTVTETWQKKMKEAGRKFAIVKTIRAIYDRVAIISDLPSLLIVEYPKRNSKGKKSSRSPADAFSIKRENIPKNEITNLRYFVEV